MGRTSSIQRLPPEVRERIAHLREQGRTIDEIMDALQRLDVDVSRSALGRHVKSLAEISDRLRRSRDMADALVRRFGDAEESKTARLNIELLHGIIFDITSAADPLATEDAEGVIAISPQQAMALAKAIDHLGKAEAANVAVVRAAREEAAKAAEQAREAAAVAAEKVAVSRGLDPEAIAAFRREILGVAG